jgi:hypothetical protein
LRDYSIFFPDARTGGADHPTIVQTKSQTNFSGRPRLFGAAEDKASSCPEYTKDHNVSVALTMGKD